MTGVESNPYNKMELDSYISEWKRMRISFSPKSILDMRQTERFLCIHLHSGDSINFRGNKEGFAAEVRRQLPGYAIQGIPGMESLSQESDRQLGGESGTGEADSRT